MRRAARIAGLLLVLLAACGGNDPSEPEAEGPVRYGDVESGGPSTIVPDTAETPSTAVVAAPTTAPATRGSVDTAVEEAPAPTPQVAARGPAVPNRSTTTHPSGLELTFVVADKLEFDRLEDISLQVSFVNRTSEDLFRNGAQAVFFEIAAGDRRWTTTSCQPDFGGQRPPATAIPIEPGADNRFVGTYPAAPGFRTRDQCRLGPGVYEAVGIVAWCPPETITRPGGGGQACDSSADVDIRSAPLEITIR